MVKNLFNFQNIHLYSEYASYHATRRSNGCLFGWTITVTEKDRLLYKTKKFKDTDLE